MSFGRAMLEHWLLDPDTIYLNHGTVGATPRRVLRKQQSLRDEMERQPSRFMLRELHGEHPMPWRSTTRLREASDQVAAFVGARADDLVLVPNVTTGLNAVLWSVPLGPGDEIVMTDLAYGAITLAAGAACERSGATLRTVHIEYPVRDAGDVVEAITRALSERTKLVVVDHVTAGTALVLPVADVAAACHARGVPVLVDGAHVPGACALDVPESRCRLVRRQPAQVGPCAAKLRLSLGGAGASGDPALPGCLVGAQPGLPSRIRARRHRRIPRAFSPRPKASRSCANGASTRASRTCTVSLQTRHSCSPSGGERRSTFRAT